MCAKRLERFQRDAVAQDVAKRKGSYEQIAKRHSISQATVSRIADEYGVGVKSRTLNRTAATEVPEETYDSSNRKAALDRLMHAVDSQIAAGGQSSKQLLDLARAAREISSARANEDKLSESYAEASSSSLGGTGYAEAFELVDCHPNGTPKNLAVYFGVLDWGEAIEAGDEETAEEIGERVKEACIGAGLHPAKVDLERMSKKIKYDFGAEMAREEARATLARKKKASEASSASEAKEEFDGRGLA